jgi:HlyD family secretion protein
MKKKVIWIVVILVVASIFVYKIKSGGQVVIVELAKAYKGDIVEYVEETGDVMLEDEIEIYSTAAGRVTKVTKKVGEAVKAGEILVELDNDLSLQIKALNAQKLSVSAKYDEIKSSANDEEIRGLSAQVRASEATYEESKSSVENNKVLYEAGAISLDTLKSSITKLAAAEASLETAKSNLATAQKGVSGNVRKQYEAQLSEIQAKIDQLKKKSEEMVIRSPIDGLIMVSQVNEGNIVQMGSKLFEIGGSKGFYLVSDVLIEDIAGIKLGSPVIIENEDIGIKDVKGIIRKIYPKAFNKMSDLGIEQKRVKVEIDLNDTVKEIRAGYEVTVKIVTQSKKDTLLIAEKAIFNYQGKDHVFVNDSGIAKLRVIEKGLESNEQVEVLKGLNEGDEVILSPDKTLEEGAKIKK